ncbi:MAG TPA: HAMP domain-containing sensor histidine kinase, partial [Acidimicrobiales bacterium]|nr:HAMP domain-containing sensor histidine kinase [Acidimicrobiales bacterium]
MSLRRRLLLVLLAVVALGLLASDFATYAFLRSSLSGRVDDQLSSAMNTAYNLVARRARLDIGVLEAALPQGVYISIFDSNGDLLLHSSYQPQPAIPVQRLPLNQLPDPDAGPQLVSLTTGSVGSSGVTYRSLAAPIPVGALVGAPGAVGALVVSVSLEPMHQTLSRLVAIEEIVTAIVLVSLGAVGLWVVKLGLRPLDEMARTAGEIARGDLSKRVATTDDRTEVGRLGRALNSMLAQIEAAFAERSASEERLRRFVADASHELRTPLTSIRGYAELYRRGVTADPEGLDRAMGRIEGEAARMGVLVDDLLLLARLDQGRPLESEPVDLARLAAEAVADAMAVDPERPISFSDGAPVVVLGDEHRLRQVAANLLSNALTHTPAGTPVQVRV